MCQGSGVSSETTIRWTDKTPLPLSPLKGGLGSKRHIP